MSGHRHARAVALEFPHHVALPAREGGWGRTLDEMHAWCAEHVGDHTRYRALAGFHFKRAEDAAAFRERWAAELAPR